MPSIVSKNSAFRLVQAGFAKHFAELFDLPLVEKMQHFNIGGRGISGYFPFNYEVTSPDFGFERKEFWQICRMVNIPVEDKGFYPQNAWPEKQKKLYDHLCDLYLSLDSVIADLIRQLSTKYSIPHEYLDFPPGNHVLRLVHYPVHSSPIAVPPHIDQTLFTLLLWNNLEGLETMSEEGCWSELDSCQEILLLEGAILERMSGDRVKGVRHRVRGGQCGQPRYSLLCFVHPPPNFVIRSLPNEQGYIHPDIFCHRLLSDHTTELGIRKSLEPSELRRS